MGCTSKRVQKCRFVCEKNECAYQPFPAKGQLKRNLKSYLELQMALPGQDGCVYCYVIETIKNDGGRFRQTGSGPNFQGGRITLCTCKHRMRTFLSREQWKGTWVAGFTGIGPRAGDGRNHLVYLMKVEFAFDSHYALWHSSGISNETKHAKAANRNKFGDVFQPGKGCITDKPDTYLQPVHEHVHWPKNWRKDIHYARGCSNREAALLVGDVAFSFLWDKPLIALKGRRLPRSQKKYERLTDFLNDLITNKQV
jgi:hypothetical protein